MIDNLNSFDGNFKHWRRFWKFSDSHAFDVGEDLLFKELREDWEKWAREDAFSDFFALVG